MSIHDGDPADDRGLHGFAVRSPARARRVAVALLAGGQTIGWAGLYYVFASLLYTWETSLGWSKAEITLGLSVALVVSAVVSPLAGRAIDAGFGRVMMSAGIVAGAIGVAGLSLVHSRLAFVLVWAWIGASQATCLYDACFAFLTRTTGADARRGITTITLAAGFASTIAFPSGAALAAALGWRGAVLVFGGTVAFVAGPLIYTGTTILECCPVRPPAGDRRLVERSIVQRVIRRPEFWLLFAAFPLVGLAEALILTHIVPILVELGTTPAGAVAAASLFGPMQVAGRVVLMRAGVHRSAVRIALIAFSGIALVTLVLQGVERFSWLAFAFTAGFGAFFGLMSILKPVLVAEQLGSEGFGLKSGLISAPTLAAFAIAPSLGSVLWERGGYSIAVAAGTAAAFLGLLAVVVLAVITAQRSGQPANRLKL